MSLWDFSFWDGLAEKAGLGWQALFLRSYESEMTRKMAQCRGSSYTREEPWGVNPGPSASRLCCRLPPHRSLLLQMKLR